MKYLIYLAILALILVYNGYIKPDQVSEVINHSLNIFHNIADNIKGV